VRSERGLQLAAPEDAPEVLSNKRVQHFVVHRAEVGAHLCVDHCCEVAEDLLEACGRRCAEARRSQQRLCVQCASAAKGDQAASHRAFVPPPLTASPSSAAAAKPSAVGVKGAGYGRGV
jgi:hypothetical protein